MTSNMYSTVLGLIDQYPDRVDDIIKQFKQYIYCGDFSKEFVYIPSKEDHDEKDSGGD